MRHQYVFHIIILVGILTAFSNLTQAQVVEKDTQRFFRLGPREFPVTAENRLSDGSAEEILQMIKREYRGESGNSVDVVWRHLHTIYNGPLYDDIMLYAIKIKLDALFRCMRSPDRDDHSGRIYDYGQLIWWRMEIENTGKSKRYSRPLAKKNRVYRVWRGEVSFGTWKTGNWYEEKFAEIEYAALNRRILSEKAEKSEADSELRPRLEAAIDRRKESLREKALNSLVTDVSEMCSHFLRQTDPSADTRKREWDNLMLKLPDIPLSLVAECGSETAQLASKMLAVKVASFILTQDGRDHLIRFAKEHGIQEQLEFPEQKKRLF